MNEVETSIKEDLKSQDTKKCSSCKETKSFSSFHKNQYICKECKKILHKKRYSENKEHILTKNKLWRESNPKYMEDYYSSNTTKWASSRRFWPSYNKNRKMQKTSKASWDLELTNFVTEEAHHLRGLRDVATGIKWHVDHVVPLNGKQVSGLHVWNNLAVIPAKENLQKGNKYED